MNGNSRQGCQRFDRHRCRGKKTPTLTLESLGSSVGTCANDGPPKRRGRRETSGSPALPHGALVSVGCPRSESCARSWERARCGCTQFVWVADIGRTHRASSPPAGRKACWCIERALARKKFVAPSDAGRGWTEGESVRVCRASSKSSCARSAGFGLQVLDTIEGVLGLLPALLSPAGRSESPRIRRSTPHHHPRGA